MQLSELCHSARGASKEKLRSAGDQPGTVWVMQQQQAQPRQQQPQSVKNWGCEGNFDGSEAKAEQKQVKCVAACVTRREGLGPP